MFHVIDLEQKSDKWKAWRRSKFTATMASCVVQCNPWMTPNELWRSICLGEEKEVYKDACEWGVKHEEPARIWASQYIGKIEKGECVEKFRDRYFAASLDGMIKCIPRIMGDKIGNEQHAIYSCDAICEIKCPGQKQFETMRREVPIYYWTQCQWQLFVTGCSVCHFIVFNGFDGYIHRINPDVAFIEKLLPKVAEFKKLVDDFEEPPLIDQDFPRETDQKYIDFGLYYDQICKSRDLLDLEIEKIKTDLDERAKELGYKRMIFGNVKYSFNENCKSPHYDMQAIVRDTGIDLEKYRKPSFSKKTFTRKAEMDS